MNKKKLKLPRKRMKLVEDRMIKMFDEDTLEDSSDSDDSNDTLVDPLSGDAEDDDNDELETFEESNNLEL